MFLPVRSLRWGSCPLLAAAALAQAPLAARADVATDGSVGPAVDLAGPDYEIPAGLGTHSGGNLFHSFERFGIAAGESATFTADGARGPIDRVLSRVTGGEPSRIDGLLRSTIPGADLYLLNPSGVLFGPEARLDVPASLHVTTADTAEFPNGERFEARPGGAVPTLAVAPPEAFGFLSERPAGIAVDHSRLAVAEGESLSLVGGDLEISGEPFRTTDAVELAAPAGRLDLVAVGSPGRVGLPTTPDAPPRLEGFSERGDVTFSGGGASTRGTTGAGRIFLRGGEIVLEEAVLESDTVGAHDAGSVDIEGGSLHVTDSLVAARANSDSTGDGGTVRIRAAGAVAVEGVAAPSRISVATAGSGRAGTIDIEASDLTVRAEGAAGDSASIHASSTRSGDAGSIRIAAERVLAEGDPARAGSEPTSHISVAALRHGPGRGGELRIEAQDLTVTGANLDAGARSTVASGSIDLVAERVAISGSKVFTHSLAPGSGGPLTIDAGELVVDGSEISATNWDTGDAGSLEIRADELRATGATIFDAAAQGPDGSAGRIDVTAQRVELTDTWVRAVAYGQGLSKSGDIRVQAGELILDHSSLDAGSLGKLGSGSVAVDAERVKLSSGSTVITHAYGGSGGPIEIVADRVELTDGAELTTVAREADGAAKSGDIRVRTGELIVDGAKIDAGSFGTLGSGAVELTGGRVAVSGSEIYTHAWGSGSGGPLTIDAGEVVIGAGSFISASHDGKGGNAGSIGIRAERVVISGSKLLAHSQSPAIGNGGSLTIDAREVLVEGGSEVSASNWGTGDAGSVAIRAQRLLVREDSVVTALSNGVGNAGAIRLEADTLDVVDSDVWATSANGEGRGGRVELAGDRIAILGGSEVRARAGGTGDAGRGAGDAGSVMVRARESLVIAGADTDIDVSTYFDGDAGLVELSAPDILLDDLALVSSTVVGRGHGGAIRIAGERIEIRGGAFVSTSPIEGGTGTIELVAGESVRISNAGGDPLSLPRVILDRVAGPSGIYAAPLFGVGESGAITIAAPLVEIVDGGVVATTTLGSTAAGPITIDAARVTLRDGGLVDSSSAGTGAGGPVRIAASDTIAVVGVGADGAPSRIRSAAAGSGAGGDIALAAPAVRLDGGAVATTTVGAGASGDGGSITIEADRIELAGGGRIDSSSFSAGDGGHIEITARERLAIAGPGSGVFAETGGAGVGGDLALAAGAVEITDGGAVSTRSGSEVASAEPVFADAVAGGFVPPLRPPPGASAGPAGNVQIAAGSFALAGGTIDTAAAQGAGGNVFVRVAGPARLEDGAISASVGSGSGGNVRVEAPLLLLRDGRILAQAEEGAGGNISVRTHLLLGAREGAISASARLGVDGRVAIDSPDVDLAGSLAALPETPLQASDLLRERCAAVRSDALSSFVVRGRTALPASYAEGLLLALVPSAARDGGAVAARRAAPAAHTTVAALAPFAQRLGCATASY